MILILLLYMLFASTFTILKVAITYTTPIFFIAMRMLSGGALLWFYLYIKNQHIDKRLSCNDIWLFMQIAFFEYFAAFVLEAWSLQWVVSYKACLFFNLSPFITAIISMFILQEHISIKKCIGLLLGFIGLLPILIVQNGQEFGSLSLSWLSLAELALFVAVFCASYGWILLKKAQLRGYMTIFINAYTMLIAGVMALISSLILEHMIPVIKPPIHCYALQMPFFCTLLGPYGAGVALFIIYMVALVLIANVFAFNLYGYLLTIYSTTFVSFAGFITPLLAAILGYVFLHEMVQWEFMLSMVLIGIGLFLFYQEEL